VVTTKSRSGSRRATSNNICHAHAAHRSAAMGTSISGTARPKRVVPRKVVPTASGRATSFRVLTGHTQPLLFKDHKRIKLS
jgi:hypothetical protein